MKIMVKSTIHNINVEHIKYKSTNAHIYTNKAQGWLSTGI